MDEKEINEIAKLTAGFSGADMKTLCQEAAMMPIRTLSMEQMETIDANDVRPVGFVDFQEALKVIRPSVSSDDLTMYTDWDKTYGSGLGKY